MRPKTIPSRDSDPTGSRQRHPLLQQKLDRRIRLYARRYELGLGIFDGEPIDCEEDRWLRGHALSGGLAT